MSINIQSSPYVSGMMSNVDILECILSGSLSVHPFNFSNLTGLGYNLSTTDFVLSVSKGRLLNIHEFEGRRYVVIPANDCVLMFTNEYIEIDKTIAGTFHSKVSRVSQGLGHFSTTLDPDWKGQLILSINNPTSTGIKVFLGEHGNMVTTVFYRLISPVKGNSHDNDQGRADLLLNYFAEPMKIFGKRKRYIQLENFIRNHFSLSINGKDEAKLDAEFKLDEFAVFFSQLQRLKERFDEDLISIEEKGMIIENGCYLYLKTREEKDIIKNCSLYEMLQKVEFVTCNEEGRKRVIECVEHNISKESSSEDCKAVLLLLKHIVNYEINTIRHRRRIAEQNRSIKPYISTKLPWRWDGTMVFLIISVIFFVSAAAGFFIASTGDSLADKLSYGFGQIGAALTALAIPFISVFINQIVNIRRKVQIKK